MNDLKKLLLYSDKKNIYISNKLMDKLIPFNLLGGREGQIFMFIMSKQAKANNEKVIISFNEFKSFYNFETSNLCHLLTSLIKRKIIKRKRIKLGLAEYSINPNLEEWK